MCELYTLFIILATTSMLSQFIAWLIIINMCECNRFCYGFIVFCNDDLLKHKSNATRVAVQTMPTIYYAWQYDIWQQTHLRGNMIYGNE